jgi:predicted DCC family thiol-disulfide oxidoreductase YuxK
MIRNNYLVLFDGHCHLCDGSVKFILKHDRNKIFTFASLQSETGKKLIDLYQIDTGSKESIIFIKKGKVHTKSSAALWIAIELSFPAVLISGLMIFPPFIRDSVYDFVAKNRYKWFGKSDHCLTPDSKERHRFIDL